jgi:hypothetical protein
VVVDIRDLWPDAFRDLLPGWTRPFLSMALHPLNNAAGSALRQAAAVIGLTPAYVEWGLKKAKRLITKWDTDFPLGYPDVRPADNEIAEAEVFWKSKGVYLQSDRFVCTFLGSIGTTCRILEVLEAARNMRQELQSPLFIICGDGDALPGFEREAHGLGNVVFPGRVGYAQLWTLLRHSSLGLAPYRDIPNYRLNIPNKVIEYLSAALPVVWGIKEGVVAEMIKEHNCGVTYDSADPRDFIEVLRRLRDDPEHCKSLGNNAYRLYQSRFSESVVYPRMCDYLEQLAADKGRAQSAGNRG